MRFFYDCEFIEDGTTIDLVSIGVVGEDGREFYAVSTEFDPTRAGPWVRAHVLPKLPSPAHPAWRSRKQLRSDLLQFLTSAPGEVELWAWIAGAAAALGGGGAPAPAASHVRRARRARRRPAQSEAVGGDRGGGGRPLSAACGAIKQRGFSLR